VIFFYRYALRSPNDAMVHMYVTNVNKSLIKDKKINEHLVAKFDNAYHTLAAKMSPKLKATTACRLVSKKLVHDNIVHEGRQFLNFYQQSEVLIRRTLTSTLLMMENIQLLQNHTSLIWHIELYLLFTPLLLIERRGV